MRRLHPTPAMAVIAGACLVSLAGSAGAEIYRADLSAPGDMRVVRDTGSGLDWLRLDETAGVDMASILSGHGGWVDSGWRHATRSETCEMLSHVFEVAETPSCAFSGDRVTVFFDLFGLLEVYADHRSVTHSTYAYYVDEDPSDPLEGMLEVIRYWEFSVLQLEAAVTRENALPQTNPFGGSNTGNLLVRASPASLPAALPLGHVVLVGFLLLAGTAATQRRGSP